MSFTTLTKVGQGNGGSDLQYRFVGTSLQKTDIQVTVIERSTPWDSFSSYSTNAERSYNGNLYRATSSISAGQNPPIHTTGTDSNNWLFLRVLSVGKNLNTHYTMPTYDTTSGGTVEFIAGSDNGLTSRGFPAGSTTQVFTVRIERVTSSNPIVEFAAGSSIKADDLNKQNKQALFVGEDTREAVNSLAVGDPQSAFQVSGSNIVPNSITTGKIDNGAIITEDLANGAVTNLKVSSTAAIDGTKISPNFGSQNIVTTGTLGSSNITVSNIVPSIFLNDTNNNDDFEIKNQNGVFTVRDATNGADRLTIASDGTTNITNNLNANAGIDVTGTCTATTFSGSGASLTSVPAASITEVNGPLPALNGANLTSLNPANIANGTLPVGVTGAAFTNKPAWYMHNSVAQSIPHNSWTAVTNYQSDESGTYSENGVSTTNGSFTIPANRGGLYVIFGGVSVVNLDAPDVIIMQFYKNSTLLGPEHKDYSPTANQTLTISGMRFGNFAAGDVIQVAVYHNEGGARNTDGTKCYFGGFRLLT